MTPDLGWLPDALRAAGYTPATLQQLLQVRSPDDVGVLNHAAAVSRLADDPAPAAVLTRLFFLETAESAPRVAAVLSPRRCRILTDAGLLAKRGNRIEARLRIDCVGEQYFISDRRFRSPVRRALGLPAGDPVYPPSSDSLLLRDAVQAPPARRLLDLCTGSGIQALQRHGQAETMVAVDINPRAVAMARCNAQLNGVAAFEACCGDLYVPLRRARFDQILANPPFVASPHRRAPSYHAGGASGDRVLRRIIAGWSRHLEPGGRAFAVSHVAVRKGDTIARVARSWFRTFPGRALVIVLETGTPIDLAAAQSLFALDRGLGAYAAEIKRWVAYLQRHRIGQVAAVLIAAEHGGGRDVQTVAAHVGVLPIPIGAPPAERIRNWFASKARGDRAANE